ncbi:hypothetical protein GCM10027073_52200 [Streptomyces chlorus]
MPGVVHPDHTKAGGLGDAGEGTVDVPRLDLATGAGGEDVAGLLPLRPRALARAAACRIRCRRRSAIQRAGSGTARRRRLLGSSS